MKKCMITIYMQLKKTIRNIKFRNRLILNYITVTTAAISIMGFILFLYSIREYKQEMAERSYEIVEHVNESIRSNLKYINRLIDNLYIRTINNSIDLVTSYFTGKIPEVPESLLSINRDLDMWSSEILYYSDDIRGLYIRGINGFEYSIFPYASYSKYGHDSIWYKKNVSNIQSNQIIHGIHRQFYYADDPPVISIVKPIVDISSNKNIGIIEMDLDPYAIGKAFNGIDLGNGSCTLICDSENKIVYATNKSLIMSKLDSEVISSIEDGTSGMAVKSLKGEESLIIYNDLNISGWRLVSTIPMNALVQKWNTTGVIILVTGSGLLILLFCISVLFAHNITKPVKNLIDRMKLVGEGDYSLSIPSDAKDEIGQLDRNFHYMIVRIKSLINMEYKAKLAEREAELKALQAQINPHFLYNTLEIISTIAILEKVPAIDEIAQSLARMFRYSIKTQKNTVPLEKEIEHLKDYLKIYSYRFDSDLIVSYDISENCLQCCILKLVLQPLVENAIIHGLNRSSKKGLINISAALENSTLIICVSDNGKGMVKSKLEEIQVMLKSDTDSITHRDTSENIGLRNVNARLSLFYGPEYGLSVESVHNSGTKVIVKIPAVFAEDTD